MENVKSEIEAFVQKTNEIINSQEGGVDKAAAVKEALKQHLEEAAKGAPSAASITSDIATTVAQKFTTKRDADKKIDEETRKEFAGFVEEHGIFKAAQILEKADPHNMDLLHDYLLGLVNKN
jgi:hypothetical protein